MNELKIVEYNCETGLEIVRDANSKEIKQYEADQITTEKLRAQAKAKETAKAALLDKLGITAEEAQLLLA